MVRRKLLTRLRELLRRYPAVALTGPRQSGKTTLARTLGGRYFDLEQEPDRLAMDLEWDGITAGRCLVVLDEAQAHPALFPRLRGAIDAARKRNGRFLLLGSVSPVLMRHVSESLAGRLALCELSPLFRSECPSISLDRLWLYGGFPDGGILGKSRFPGWQANYVEMLSQRDLPQWGLPARPQATLRFLHMVAACHGTVWNASEIGRSLGLSYHTANSYLDLLEGAFLVRRLHPFHANIRKRLVKSPKVYWRDTGLLHSMLGATSMNDLLRKPWVGLSWEGFVIGQALEHLAVRGITFTPSFARTSDGYEADLVLVISGRRLALEVKLTSSPGSADMARLSRTAALIKADRCILVSRTAHTVATSGSVSTNLDGLLDLLSRI